MRAHILYKHIYKDKEEETYKDIAFEMQELHDAVGNTINIHDSVREVLQHRWRYPSLSLHGVEGAFYSPGDKTVIPAKVIGKFSIRTVPDMDPEHVTQLVKKYVTDEFEKLGSKNAIKIECSHAGNHWLASPDHWSYGKSIVERKKEGRFSFSWSSYRGPLCKSLLPRQWSACSMSSLI